MKLVVFERDWADEFSPFGFAVMTEAEWEEFKEYHSKPQEWYFGTNEGFTEDDGSTMDGVTVKDITNKEADLLTRLFDLIKPYGGTSKERGLFPPRADP